MATTANHTLASMRKPLTTGTAHTKQTVSRKDNTMPHTRLQETHADATLYRVTAYDLEDRVMLKFKVAVQGYTGNQSKAENWVRQYISERPNLRASFGRVIAEPVYENDQLLRVGFVPRNWTPNYAPHSG